jgi:isoleucyl-tRNA synthetase
MRVVALQGGPALRRALAEYGEVVREELNLKSVAVSEEPVSYRLSLDKKNAARRLGALTPVVVEALEGLDAVGTAEVFRSRTVPTSQGPVALEAGELKVVVAAPEGTAAHFDGSLTVLLDTRITPELEAEGIAREVVRRLNELRKKAGLKVEDRIRVRWHATGKAAAALATWSSWTAAEVLAESFEAAATPEGLDPLEVPGHEVRASIAHA